MYENQPKSKTDKIKWLGMQSPGIADKHLRDCIPSHFILPVLFLGWFFGRNHGFELSVLWKLLLELNIRLEKQKWHWFKILLSIWH